MPVSGQLYETAAEGATMLSRFPVAFRHTGIRLLDHPAPAEEFSLPHGRPTGLTPGPDGVVTFRTAEIRPGRVPSEPRDGDVPTTGS